MSNSFGRIIIYTKKTAEMIEFYTRHFNYEYLPSPEDKLVELRPKSSGIIILLHPAGKGMKEGQVLLKLVFDVDDVEAFCEQAKLNGLTFGKIHKGEGYIFANAKDPSKNSISVSGRGNVSKAR